jgi:acetone carboxylase gamma subunit
MEGRLVDERRRITEYLDLDISMDRWLCNRCGADLGSSRGNYKKGCLIAARDPSEVHPPIVDDSPYSFAPDREWCQIVEFYCPQCATLIEVEYLPPGHPITHDIELDIDAIKAANAARESVS